MKRFVVGVNAQRVSRDALAWAYGAAVREHAELEIVTVYRPVVAVNAFDGYPVVDDENARVAASATQAAALADVLGRDEVATPIRGLVRLGDPVAVLVDRAARAGLLVVGRRVHRWSRWLWPSTSTRCVDRSSCPVVVVREQLPRSTRRYRAELSRLEHGVAHAEVSRLRLGLD
jgi:nucleotide-binding universal stress UspA family protein